MIKPNFDLMLWIIFVGWVIKIFCSIILGIARQKKDTHYGWGDIIAGIIALIIIIIILIL